jgi:membrane protease YdiL (CAAX protease family)
MTHARAPIAIALALCTAIAATRILGFIVSGALGGSEADLFAGGLVSYAGLGASVLASLGALALALRLARVSLADLGWRRKDLPRAIGIGLVGGALAITLVVALSVGLGGDSPAELAATIRGFTPAQHLFFVVLGIWAGFLEESAFRGLLQAGLERRVGRALALVITALVFAAYHLKFRPLAFGGKLVLGLLFGGLRNASRGLVSPAIAHALVWSVIGIA